MSKIALVTDSTAYLPTELIKKYNISVTPQILIWGDESYNDGVDITPNEFYARLKTAKSTPTTSQVPIPVMQKVFQQLIEQDYTVLGLFISSSLSGTMQSALQAREMMGVGQDKVVLVDSASTAMAMGFQVLSAARAAAEGANINDCINIASQARENSGVYFVVDTLEFLHRGGRIGGAQRFLGSALNLKPILAVQNGKVEAIDRVRTKGKAIARVLDLIEEQIDGKSPVRLATLHANSQHEARELLDTAAERFKATETFLSEVSPVIGTHAGPGTVGLAYMAGL